MNTFIKKHQKKFMAIFAVGLMITFTASFGNFGPTAQNPVIAHIGSDPIKLQESSDSRRLWARLNHTGMLHVPLQGVQEGQAVPAAYILGPDVKVRIDQDPDTFLLLQKEAKKLGLTASPDGVEELMQNQVTLTAESAPEDVLETRAAFAAMLAVKAAYDRAASVVKVTQPQRDYDVALLGQTVTLKYVSYNADEFKAAVTAPTPDQLKTQFDKYKDELADQPSATDPFAFGYKVPNRVKLDVLTIRRADLRAAAKQSKSPADWELAARIQYNRNKDQYPATRPSDTPSLPVGVAAPSTQPTTRPLAFADYHEQIVSELMDTDEYKLLSDVRTKIASTLQADYNAYRTATGATTKPTSRPTSGPSTDLGVSYDSDQYLPKLALAIQQEFKVLPAATRYGKDWLTQKDLSALPEVGSAEYVNYDMTSQQQPQPITLSEYTFGFLDAFGHETSPRDQAPTLSLLSPSPALTDLSRNVHMFRVIAEDPAHATDDMATVAKQVETDYRTAAAQAKAREAIDKLLPIAKSNNLDAAAVSAGRKVFTTGIITRSRGMAPNADLQLKPASQQILTTATFDLLKKVDDVKNGKAIAVVELPLDGKVLLVSPADIKTIYPTDLMYRLQVDRDIQVLQETDPLFRAMWFDPKEVQKRMDYKVEEKKKDPAAAQ